MTNTPTDPGTERNGEAEREAPPLASTAAPKSSKTAATANPRVRVGAVVALALVAGIVVWLIVGRSSNSNTTATQTTTSGPVVQHIGPVALSAASLRSKASSIGQPVYWTGVQPGHTYEFSRTTNGNVYVRYLPNGVKAGAGTTYLTVATYPDANAYRGLLGVANGQQVKIPGGGIAVVDTANPTSVRVAFPGVPFQLEVFDPSAATALQVATSGKVTPVG